MTEAEAARQPSSPPIRDTVRAAWTVIRERPRQVLLPLLVIQVPLAILTVVISAGLYGTVFSDEPYPEGGLMGGFVDLEGQQLFAVLVVFGASLLFSTIGHGATVVAVAAAARGESMSLSNALDPGFTRIGGLLIGSLTLAAGATLLLLTVVGIVVLPYLLVRLWLWLPIYMLEEKGAFEALQESWRLMPGHFLRLLILLLITALIAVVLAAIVSLPLAFEPSGRSARIILDSIISLLQGTLLVPAVVFFHAVTTIYYLGVKSRYEQQQRPA